MGVRQNVLSEIEDFINNGCTPIEIMAKSSRYGAHERFIHKTFVAHRMEGLDPERQIRGLYHVIKPLNREERNRVKTAIMAPLYDMYGKYNVINYVALRNQVFNSYECQPVLVLNQVFDGKEDFDFEMVQKMFTPSNRKIFNSLLRGYVSKFVPMWHTIHIISELYPEQLAEKMNWNVDKFLRYLNGVVCHFDTQKQERI